MFLRNRLINVLQDNATNSYGIPSIIKDKIDLGFIDKGGPILSEAKNHFEIFRDPFRMLLQLIELICESKGLTSDFTTVPFYENNIFVLSPNDEENQENRSSFIFKTNMAFSRNPNMKMGIRFKSLRSLPY